jgi:DNA-3-methyladenine glycosylase II
MRRAVLHLKKSDPVMRGIIERVGPCRISYQEPEFKILARAIVFQQLNGTAAAAIFGRFETLCSRPGTGLQPEGVLRAPLKKLRAAGLSAKKAEYVRDLARKTSNGTVRLDSLADLTDDDVIEALTQVKGVGVWTAHMFMMFALRRPNVLAEGDYGVRAAMKKAYGLAELPKVVEVRRIAEPWHPWCTAACWYLWQSLKVTSPAAKP